MNNITKNDIINHIEKIFRELTPIDQDDILIIEAGLKLIRSFFCSKNSLDFMSKFF